MLYILLTVGSTLSIMFGFPWYVVAFLLLWLAGYAGLCCHAAADLTVLENPASDWHWSFLVASLASLVFVSIIGGITYGVTSHIVEKVKAPIAIETQK